jgi:uncharacterized protein (UPF0548 family)
VSGRGRAGPSGGRCLTYAEVGATAGPLPPGYRHLRVSRTVGVGRDVFARGAAALLDWQVQRRSGARVLAAGGVTEGAEALLRFGPGRLSVSAPVRVVYVVDEPRRHGFAYGTLPGHPVSGEEAFLLELRADDSVVLSVTAFSRPARWPVRVAGPLAGLGQRLMAERYLRSLDGPAAAVS